MLNRNSQGDKVNRGGQGFTLIELMSVVVIMTIGMLGVMSLIDQIAIKSRLTNSKLVAAYLSQEGIEIVRNIRDSNWLESTAWDSGLGAGDWEADYNDQALSGYTGNPLNIDTTNGFYNYSAGNPSKFSRRITISDSALDSFKVAVEVSWQEFGQTYTIKVLEKLYDWR